MGRNPVLTSDTPCYTLKLLTIMGTEGGSVIQRRDLAGQILASLKQEIIAGKRADGEHLAEEKLAAAWGTSRGPVRDALQRLVQDGLATSLPNGRTIVTRLQAPQVADLYQIRLGLEHIAADLAVARAADNQLQQLRAVAAELDHASPGGGADGGDDRRRIDLDLQLHRHIVMCANSLPLLRLWEGLGDTIGALVAATSLAGFDLEAIRSQHQRIVAALVKRDAAAAKAWLTVHLYEARDQLIADLNRRQAAEGTVAGDVRLEPEGG